MQSIFLWAQVFFFLQTADLFIFFIQMRRVFITEGGHLSFYFKKIQEITHKLQQTTEVFVDVYMYDFLFV